jgi:hypothetical protein
MNEAPKKAELVDRPPDTNMLPPTFDPAYVQGAVKPFFLSTKYEGEPPLFPMIDLVLSKEAAVQPHIFGMQRYYQRYFDMYWDLHLGVRGEDIPPEVREIGSSFIAVLGFWHPTTQVVYDNYMRVRQLRPLLKDWIDKRIQDIIDRRVPNPEKTMVYYWIKNGELGENFTRKDMVFECFHNFLAFSQWGNTLYNIMSRLETTNGDPAVRSWFEKTMKDSPDERIRP